MLNIKGAVGAVAIVAGFSTLALSGGERIDFPAHYKTSFTQYWAGERANGKQYAITYANDVALAAAKAGGTVADGGQIVMEIYKLAEDGTAGDFAAVAVMQNKAGWGADYPEDMRNGDWDFGVFTPAGKLKKADASSCLGCHLGYEEASYMHLYDQLAAKAGE